MPYLSLGNASKKNPLWREPSEMFTQIIGPKRKPLRRKQQHTLSPCESFYWGLFGNVEIYSSSVLLICVFFFLPLFLNYFFFSTATNPCLRMSCDFMCLLNPTGAKCTCPEGKVLVNGTCSDVNMSGGPRSAPDAMQSGDPGVTAHTMMMLSCVIVVPFQPIWKIAASELYISILGIYYKYKLHM